MLLNFSVAGLEQANGVGAVAVLSSVPVAGNMPSGIIRSNWKHTEKSSRTLAGSMLSGIISSSWSDTTGRWMDGPFYTGTRCVPCEENAFGDHPFLLE